MSVETVGLLTLLVTIIASIILIYQNVVAHRFQKKTEAEQKKSIEKKVTIEFFEAAIKNIIFVGDFPPKSIIKVPLTYCIANIGKTKIANSELYITYPNALHEQNKSNMTFQSKGSLSDVNFKLVDKSEYLHMLGFNTGDFAPNSGGVFHDQLFISDHHKTDTTVHDMETVAETKDKVKVKLKFRTSIHWVIHFFLRHDEGSYADDCYINFWNTNTRTLKEHFELYEPEQEKMFEEYLKSFNAFMRKMYRNKLRKIWNRTIRETSLFIELELQKDNRKYPIPKNAPKDAKDNTIYDAVIRGQKLLNVLNDGNVILVDRKEFEKVRRISKLNISNHGLSK